MQPQQNCSQNMIPIFSKHDPKDSKTWKSSLQFFQKQAWLAHVDMVECEKIVRLGLELPQSSTNGDTPSHAKVIQNLDLN
jgi:hypothetical protein